MYSKALLHGDTIKCTACEAKTKLCKITNIHMTWGHDDRSLPSGQFIHVYQGKISPRSICGSQALKDSQFLHIRPSFKYHPNTDHIKLSYESPWGILLSSELENYHFYPILKNNRKPYFLAAAGTVGRCSGFWSRVILTSIIVSLRKTRWGQSCQ